MGKGLWVDHIPLNTTDKRVAQQRLEQIVREKQLESVGILPPQAIRKASQTPLEKHLCDYLADLQAVGRGDKYIYDLKNRIHRLMHECLWAQIKDVVFSPAQIFLSLGNNRIEYDRV